MMYDKDVSPKKLAILAESWTRDELKDGIQYFTALAKEDSYFYRHARELIEEMEVRDQLG